MEVPIQLLCEDGIIDGKYLTMYALSLLSWKRVCTHVGLHCVLRI